MTATELRRLKGLEMGLGSWFSPWTGTAAEFERLSLADRVELTNRMRAYIRENPAEFPAAVVTVAHSGTGATSAPDSYGITAAAADFFGEISDQAADLNQTLNPFSERNRGYVLAAVAVGLVLYFAGPAIIAALRAPAKAGK